MGNVDLSEGVFRRLADGRFHSGQALAAELGVSRSAVWKAAGGLRALGVQVQAVPKRGYRLARPLVPLRAAAICQALAPQASARLRHGAVHWALGSTNAELLERQDLPPGQFDFLLAEHQSAGRGRRGRQWLAPPGGALCLSLSWAFRALPRAASALSLVMGVAVLRALAAAGGRDVQLKWPNDLQIADRKLGGILIELRAESAGPALVVIGIGLNVALGESLRQAVLAAGTNPTDLNSAGLAELDRNDLAAAILSEAVRALLQFEQEGFAPFIAPWRAADALRARPILVQTAQETRTGVAQGIDEDGSLLLSGERGLERFVSGEVSVRAQP